MREFTHFVSTVWQWLPGRSILPAQPFVVIAILCGAVSAIYPRTWQKTKLFATYVHEIGHALIALLTGRRVISIRLETDASGSTRHAGLEDAHFSRFLTTLAGYPAPAAIGYLIVLGLSVGHARFVLGAFYLVVLLFAFIQHSIRGWAVTLLVLSFCVILTIIASGLMEMFLFLVAGYLLFASPRTIVELHQVHVHGKKNRNLEVSSHSDAQALAEMTGLGTFLWEILFMAICLACLYYSFRLAA